MLTTKPDHVIATRNTPLVINVLKNDHGVNARIVATSGAGYGSLSVNDNQTITYRPLHDFIGLDSFSYTIRDINNDTANAVVTIQVIENNKPIAVDDVVTVTTGEEILIPALANDNDPDAGDRISLIASTAPSFGSISLGAQPGTFRYLATSGYTGLDSFVYTIRDSFGQTATGRVTITVNARNDAPLLKMRRLETFEDVPLEIDLLSSASDADGDAIHLHRVGRPGHGDIAVTGGRRGFYTPSAGFVGLDSFSYAVRDDRGAVTDGEIQVRVKEKNKIPVAADDNIEVENNSSVNINVLANDFDLDGDQLTVTSALMPEHGAITVNLDNTITYTPSQGYVGEDRFGYAVTDGKSEAVEALVTVNVLASDATTFANGYVHRRRFVVPADRVEGDTTLENFPIFLEEQANWLKTTAHGGKIAHDQGYDIRFELPDGVQLDHELESYDPVTGSLRAWVRLPRLEAASNTEFYLYYGKPSLSTIEEWAVGVWQNYLAVIDCETGADRSGNGHDAIASNVDAATLVGAAGRYNGVNSKLDVPEPGWLDNLDALTAQVVFKSEVTGGDQALVWVGVPGIESEVRLGLYYDGAPDDVIWGRVETTNGTSSAKSISGAHTTEPYWAALTWSRNNSVKIYGQGAPLELANTPKSPAGLTQISGAQGTNTAPLFIGAGNAHWNGIIDEVRFCADELSSAWLATEYRNQREPRTFYGIGSEEQVDSSAASIALPETFSTIQDTAVDLDVLANDLGDGLVIEALSTPIAGAVVDLGDGQGPLRYTPSDSFVGVDYIDYTVVDPRGYRSQATVRIEVEEADNRPPDDPLIAPSGVIAATPVTFSWKPTENATDYLLRVRSPGVEDVPLAKKLEAIAFGCESGTCSFTTNELAAGQYDWEVRPFIGEEKLDFSPSLSFTLEQNAFTLPAIPDALNTINVSNNSQLNSAIATAQPGDHIVLANGTYSGNRDLTTQGTAAAPIVIKAANIGQAIYTGELDLKSSSKHTVIQGLTFDDKDVVLAGEYNRIRQCYFNTELEEDKDIGSLRLRDAISPIIDYCDFTVKSRPFTRDIDRGTKYNSVGFPGKDETEVPFDALFYGCYFHDYPAQGDPNYPNQAYQTPFISPVDHVDNVNQHFLDVRTVWRNCLFERCNTGFKCWESKSMGVTIEFCTFVDCDAYNSFRQGGGCTARGNWLENFKNWRAHGVDCKFFYNKFIGAEYLIMAGQIDHTNYSSNAAARAYNTLLVGNEGKLVVGETFGGEAFNAKNTRIEGHIGEIDYRGGWHEGTVEQEDITHPEPAVTPFKLTADDVGPLANL